MTIRRDGKGIVRNTWWLSYVNKCPKCKSKKIEGLGKYRFLFHKTIPTEELHRCNACNEEFWFKEKQFIHSR